MKNIALTIVSICFYFAVNSQNSGIEFVKGMTWRQIKAKAKMEHKFIFMDCNATWCIPCKYMMKNIFSLREVGEALNSEFISVSVQLDSSKMDSDTTKSWYGDAHIIAVKYKVNAYPTYLFFSPEGKLVHRAVGLTDAHHFLVYSNEALNPDRQYYSMIDKFEKGNRDTVLLGVLAQQASANGDTMLTNSVLRAWFANIRDPFTKQKLGMILEITKTSTDPGFEFFYRNATQIDQIEKPDFAETMVMGIIIQENELLTTLNDDSTAVPDWDQINHSIARKYNADYAHRIVSWVKVPYYKMKENYGVYGTCLVSYLKEYGNHLQGKRLNNYAWDIFEYCTKPEDLAFGISCILRTLQGDQKSNAGFIDTYANLLYKSGQTDEAIKQESKALELIDTTQRPAYQSTLDKMKAGKKTWD